MESWYPESDEAVVFTIPLDASDAVVATNEALLSAEERDRADRFVLPELRRRFVVCRGCLRQLLGSATERAASDIRFRYERWGKPQLVSDVIPALHFNVSHSSDWALIALSRSPVGIDLEVPTGRVQYRSIVSQVLSPSEQAGWDALPASEREAAIMRLWVCKEALLKAMGLGIAEGLRQVSFPMPIPLDSAFRPTAIDAGLQLHIDDDGSCHTNAWIDVDAWSIRMLDVLPRACAAITVSRRVERISRRDFPF